ncbi:MAG TPA: hypothetical protein VML55_18295 [Planctomycetaceae bacterium]|nr:hypothetical protein [Planctomycetaceae bacterium]
MCSHLIVPAGGKRFHVLSRVADAGQDYTGRSNKLAHHVAIEPHERPAGNPAWVLRSPGFSQTSWNGTPRVLPSGRRAPSGTRGPAVCHAWKQAAGDAGWAGVLVASAVEPDAKPVSVIFPAGMDVLPLVEEALALVPGDRQWEVTFSTYFTKLPAGIDCQWRFLLEDSPEAQALRRNPHAAAIDLCRPLVAPPATPYAEAASAGRIVAAREPERSDSVFRRTAGASSAVPPPAPISGSAGAGAPPSVDSFRSTGPRAALPPTLDELLPSSASASHSRTLMITIAAAVLLVAVGVGAAMYLAGGSDKQIRLANTQGADSPGPRPPVVRESEDAARRRQAREKADLEDEERQRQELADRAARAATQPTEKTDRQLAHVSEGPKPGPVAERGPETTRPPLEDVRRPDRPRIADYPLLKLPQIDYTVTASRDPQELARIFVGDSKECDLGVAGSQVVLGRDRHFRVEREDEGGARRWNVKTYTPGDLNPLQLVARFSLKEQVLTFQWDSFVYTRPKSSAEMLRYCLLTISAAGEQQTCALAAPTEVGVVRFDLNNRRQVIPIQLPIPREADELVRLDLLIQAGDELPISVGNAMQLTLNSDRKKPSLQILVGKPDAAKPEGGPPEGGRPEARKSDAELRNRCVEFDVSFIRGDSGLQVTAEAYVFPALYDTDFGNLFHKQNGFAPNGPPPRYRFDFTRSSLWNRAEFEKLRTEARKRKTELAGEFVVQSFAHRIRGRQEAVRTAPPDRLVQTQNTLDAWIKARDDHQKVVELIAQNEIWCDEMEQFFGQIEKQLRIGYRVYIVVEGQEIELVKTVGWPPAAE